MADLTVVDNPTSGAITVLTDERTDSSLGGPAKVQYVALIDGTVDGANKLIVTSGGAAKVDGSASTQPVSGAVTVSGTVTVDTEIPAPATVADATANPSVPSLAVLNLIYNGTNWDRARGDTTNGLDVDVTRLPALVAGSALIGSVDVNSVPAAARATDTISSAHATDVIMSNLTALTPKFAKANVAASTTDGAIVAAVAAKQIRVLSYRLQAGATATNVTFNTKPGGAGTAVTELIATGPTTGSSSQGFSPVGHFQTAAGEGLSVTTGTGSTVGVGVVYIEVG